MSTSRLPFAPVTTNHLRVLLDEAQLEVAVRAASIAERVDRSHMPTTSYDMTWLLAAGRDFAALDAAVTARFVGSAVAA